MKIKLSLNGVVTSKRALHIPKIRKWKLVWERVELGTKVDPFTFSKTFDALDTWTVKLTDDITITLDNMIMLKYGSIPLYTWAVPTFGTKEIAWKGEVYKGVHVDISAHIDVLD